MTATQIIVTRLLTWCALQLSLLGVGSLRIVDGDDVELSNLNRQVLYNESDIGVAKVEAAKGRIETINPYVEVETFQEFVSRDEGRISDLLGGVDFVILAWASLGYYRKNTVEEVVHKFAEKNQIPVMELGGDPIDISVGPLYLYDGTHAGYKTFVDTQKKSYYSQDDTIVMMQKARMQQKFSNGNRVVNAWQSAPSLATMSGLVCDQVIKVLSGYAPALLLGKRFHLSLSTFDAHIENVFNTNYD